MSETMSRRVLIRDVDDMIRYFRARGQHLQCFLSPRRWLTDELSVSSQLVTQLGSQHMQQDDV